MNEKKIYNKYSEYLRTIYGEKVYKLPVQLPVTCPNRISGGGCSFCAEVGTGFEALKPTSSITEQLSQTQILIQKKYNKCLQIFCFKYFKIIIIIYLTLSINSFNSSSEVPIKQPSSNFFFNISSKLINCSLMNKFLCI